MALTFQDIKDGVDITDNEEYTNRKLTKIEARAKAHLENRACRKIDWDNEERYHQLLIDCIKYIWSNSLSEFDKEYADELNSLYLDGLGEKNES